jgi:hypothetical protein
MILLAVAVGTVDHHRVAQAFFAQPLADLGHLLRLEVRTGPRPASQDDVTHVVAGGLEDGRDALLGHRREQVR